ncbi:hypothetical protein BJY04DRAFT_191807 [Aspergillus karnatakaensis]|uniref:uncharacterized protein n=1 Tax=Aspergillus karnatakaensis TaxID=1810916 RepID=UPI003CCD5841
MSSAMDSAPAPAANFMFVGYEHDNPESESMNKKKRIFAQRSYQRKRKQAAVDRLKTSTQAFRQRLPLEYTAANESSEIGEDEHGLNSTITNTREARQMMQLAKSTAFPSAYLPLGQGFIDPFSTSVVPMTNIMNSYFHHLRHFTIRQSYPLDASRMSVWWWQKAIAEPAIQQALLCSAASHQTAMCTLNNVPFQYTRKSIGEFLRLRGDTIKILNGILQNPEAVAESTILIVGSLRAIEAISGSFEGAAAHTRGLEVLINLVGGLEAIEHMVLSKVYHGDILRAALTNSMPNLQLTARWRGEILQETKVFQSENFLSRLSDKPETFALLSSLGTSFFDSTWYAGLEPSMKTLLRIFQRLVQYYEVAQLCSSVIMPTDNDLFVLFEHQIVSTKYTSPNDISESIRISLLVYLNMRVWHFQSFPIMQHMVEPLRQLLVSRLDHFKKNASDLLFWLLFIGGMASQGHQGHLWFVNQLTEIMQHQGIDEWEKARSILGGFFYTDQPEETGGEDLWNEVLIKKNYHYIAPTPSFQERML